MEWEHYGAGAKWAYWRGVSPKYGPVKLQHSRKAKRWYLMTDRLFSETLVLGDFPDRKSAMRAAEG